MQYNYTEIGKRILKERKSAGYSSQSDFAIALSYSTESRQTVANWEKGKTMPCIDDLLKMCEIFKCELGYLLCEYDCKTRETTDIQATIGLSEEAVNVIKEVTNPKRVDRIHELNRFLTSNGFPDFFESLCDLHLSSVLLKEQSVSLQKQENFIKQDDIFKYMHDVQQMKIESYNLNKAFIRLVDEMCPEPTMANSIINEYAEKLAESALT